LSKLRAAKSTLVVLPVQADASSRAGKMAGMPHFPAALFWSATVAPLLLAPGARLSWCHGSAVADHPHQEL